MYKEQGADRQNTTGSLCYPLSSTLYPRLTTHYPLLISQCSLSSPRCCWECCSPSSASGSSGLPRQLTWYIPLAAALSLFPLYPPTFAHSLSPTVPLSPTPSRPKTKHSPSTSSSAVTPPTPLAQSTPPLFLQANLRKPPWLVGVACGSLRRQLPPCHASGEPVWALFTPVGRTLRENSAISVQGTSKSARLKGHAEVDVNMLIHDPKRRLSITRIPSMTRIPLRAGEVKSHSRLCQFHLWIHEPSEAVQ